MYNKYMLSRTLKNLKDIESVRSYILLIHSIFFIVTISACFYDTEDNTQPTQTVECLKNADCPDKQGCYVVTKQCIPVTSECIKSTNNQLLPLKDGNSCALQNTENAICLSGECKQSICGDRFVDLNLEECDDGNTLNHDDCTNQCNFATCGDGFHHLGEECDDGNTVSGDGCRADCQKKEICGDAIIDQGEECDDGNLNPVDACDRCQKVEWQTSIITGLGRHQSDPLKTPLIYPQEVFINLDGSIFIATKCQIYRLSPDQQFITQIAGQKTCGFSGDGGHSTSAQFKEISSIFVTPHSEIYIADQEDQRIRKIDQNGIVSTIVGTGQAGFSGDGGLAIAAQIKFPSDLYFHNHALYFSDRYNNRIRKVDQNGIITTIAGNGEEGDFIASASATGSPLRYPSALLFKNDELYFANDYESEILKIDGNGDLISYFRAEYFSISEFFYYQNEFYLLDQSGREIRKLNDEGHTTLLISSYAEDSPEKLHTMKSPSSIFVNDSGIYYTDADNHQLERYQWAQPIKIIAGTGQIQPEEKIISAKECIIEGFNRMVLDQNILYFSDLSHSGVRFIDLREENQTVQTIKDTRHDSFENAETSATVNGFPLTSPFYVLNGTTYILDAENGFIRMINQNNMISEIETDIDLFSIDSIYVYEQNIYLLDQWNNQVSTVNLDGEYTLIAGNGDDDFYGDGDLAVDAALSGPTDVFVYADEIYISDAFNDRIRKIDQNGIITTIAGNGGEDFEGDPDLAINSDLAYPSSLFINQNGIYLTDSYNLIRKIDHNGIISIIAGNEEEGFYGDNGPALEASLSEPASLFIQGDDIYFADLANHRIRKIDENGKINSLLGNANTHQFLPFDNAKLQSPRSLVTFNQNMLFSANADFNQIQSIDFTSGHSRSLIGKEGGYPLGLDPNSSSDQLEPENQYDYFRLLNKASGLAYNDNNTLFISEQLSGNILMLDMPDLLNSENWTIQLLAGNINHRSIKNGDLSDAEFFAPSGLAYDFNLNRLYVSEPTEHIIRMIDLDSGIVSTIFGHEGIAAPFNSYLDGPSGLVVGHDSSLYISDKNNHRVIRLQTDGEYESIIGTGEAASSGDGFPSNAFPVNAPKDLAIDDFGNLFITSSTSLRMISANDNGVVDGNNQVITLYGKAPRDHFPENVTQCLSGVTIRSEGVINFTDFCQGYLLELRKQ